MESKGYAHSSRRRYMLLLGIGTIGPLPRVAESGILVHATVDRRGPEPLRLLAGAACRRAGPATANSGC